MDKVEVLSFIHGVKPKEDMIEQLTQQKIDEFMVARDALFNRLDTMLTEFFPAEIVELLDEYINTKHRKLVVGNLWVEVYRLHDCVRVQLDPNYYTVEHQVGKRGSHNYRPVTLNGLKSCVDEYNDYLLLESVLKDKISEVYETLCEWKTSQYEEQLAVLNRLSFPITEKAPERYKISIVIERV